MSIKPPLPRPCGSCPYRRDVPSGVWDLEEYLKLAEYDAPTADQPVGAFSCHQANGHLCGGWCGTHDMDQSLALRLAAAMGRLSPTDVTAVLDYTSPVPLFESGAAAAAHGLADLNDPSPKAQRIITRLTRKLTKKETSVTTTPSDNPAPTHHLVPKAGVMTCTYCKRTDVSTQDPCDKAPR